MKIPQTWTRRRFVSASAASLGGLNLLTSRKAAAQTGNGVVLGEGEHRYEVIHDWAKLPDKYTWQTTHNVAVDSQNRLYVIHEGRAEQKDHPSVFVFDEKGVFVRAFGSEFQGGGHGLEVRKEAEGEFVYITGYQQVKKIAKFTLEGEKVWEKFAPMTSGLYAAGEDTKPEKVWGRDRFMPTNFAFLPDGGYFVADGYGSYTVLQYDKDSNWVRTIGTPGKEDGQFSRLDRRPQGRRRPPRRRRSGQRAAPVVRPRGQTPADDEGFHSSRERRSSWGSPPRARPQRAHHPARQGQQDDPPRRRSRLARVGVEGQDGDAQEPDRLGLGQIRASA